MKRALFILTAVLSLAVLPAQSDGLWTSYTDGTCEGTLPAVIHPTGCLHAESADANGNLATAVHIRPFAVDPVTVPTRGSGRSISGYRVAVHLDQPVAVLEITVRVYVERASLDYVDALGEGVVLLQLLVDGPCSDCFPNGDVVYLFDSRDRDDRGALENVRRTVNIGIAPVPPCDNECAVPAGDYAVDFNVLTSLAAIGRADVSFEGTVEAFGVSTHPL